jgi:amino acid transporter
MSTTLSAKASPVAAPILARTVTWKSAFVISLGAALLIATSLGAIAGDLGPASVFVWSLVIAIGILQCLMIAEMAGMFPNKSGGTAVYSHEAFKKWPLIGAIANWGYWCGWVPVIPVNLIVAAGYLKTFAPHMTDGQVLIAAIVMALFLYALNYIGLKPGIWSSAVMAVCAIAPMVVIIVSPALHPHLFHASNLIPFKPLNGSWHSHTSWMLIIKWMFVALWSAYGIEAASTTIAELKDPHKDGPKAMLAASVGGFIAYGVLTQDASVAFLPAAQAIFGHAGGVIVSIMLITALLLGVQTTIIGSSRSMYQMTHDGQMIKQFGIINKFGVPVGSMFVDMAVTIAMLLIFKNNVINLIAASNVGYIIVWLVLVPAYIVLRIKQPDAVRPFKLPGFFVPLAVIITLFNVFVFIVGGPQWDATPISTVHPFGHAMDLTVMGVGWTVMLLFVPFYLYRRFVQDKQPSLVFATSGGGLPELQEGQDDLGGRREVIHHED